jgi:type IX secretion system PorP/SprF family membrane protein
MEIWFMKTFLTYCFILFSLSASAQQDPLYAQYLLNPLTINPAQAGLNNNLNVFAGYRVQWAGFEGQPNTLNASVNSSLAGNKLGIGVLFINDQIGNLTNSEMNVAAAYKLDLDHYVISFGMQAGLQQFKTDFSDLSIYDPNDIAFRGGQRESRMNIGAGAAFKSDHFFLGLSVPRLLPTTFKNGGQEFELYSQHYYLLSSYLHYLSENIWIKPSILARGVKGAPLSLDAGLNMILNGRHMAGVFSRSFTTYGLLLQTVINDRFIFGYVFEVPTNKSIGARFTTHEVTVGLRISALSFHDNTMSHF